MLAAFVFLAVAAPVPARKVVKAPVITLVKAMRGIHGNAVMTFEVTNPNATPMPYLGYWSDAFEGGQKEGEIAPIYRIEVAERGGWKEREVGWCGDLTGPVAIPPKGKGTFSVYVPGGDWDRMRVGLTLFKTRDGSSGSEVTFSAPVSWAEVLATPKR